jgi:hypothetical protein
MSRRLLKWLFCDESFRSEKKEENKMHRKKENYFQKVLKYDKER